MRRKPSPRSLPRRLTPCFLTCNFPTETAFAIASALAAADGPAVVLISSREADDYGRRVASCGARGFIPKSKLSAATFAALLE